MNNEKPDYIIEESAKAPGIRRIKLTVEYDGMDFHGWQRQPTHKSVQGCIEDAIEKITGERCTIHGSGRTDAGVHGRAQVCHFDTTSKCAILAFKTGINRFTPDSIGILSAEEVEIGFHSRFTATHREYEFWLFNRREPSPLWDKRAVHVGYKLDLDKMQSAAKLLEGTHDFSAFRTSACESEVPTCTLEFVKLWREGDFIKMHLKGDHFLHNMVRIIMGTLVDVGRSRIEESAITEMFNTGDRIHGGKTLPPQGLYFLRVHHKPHKIFESTKDDA